MMNSFLRYTRHSAALATTALAGSVFYNAVGSNQDSSFSFQHATTCEAKAQHQKSIPYSKPGTKLLFLGSGSSTGCPKPICALTFQQSLLSKEEQHKANPSLLQLQKDMEVNCQISKIASMGDPKLNKNYRNNPSLLISHRNNDDGDGDGDSSSSSTSSPLRNVIIDVGKTFREGALRWMPHHGIYNIDGIVLTHEHADAILGLDDLRGFQISPHMMKGRGMTHTASLPVFLSPLCLDTVKQVFSYLVPKELSEQEKRKEKEDASKGIKVVRYVASLDFQTVQFFQPFYAAGLKMIPLPVKHGEDLICNGYAFSVNGDKGETINVVYLSDISRMIPETEKYIMEELPPTDILVVDSLLYKKKHSVHYSLDQALELVERLKAKKTFIVGMNCDDFPEHEDANRLIQERNSTVELAHDGLAIEF